MEKGLPDLFGPQPCEGEDSRSCQLPGDLRACVWKNVITGPKHNYLFNLFWGLRTFGQKSGLGMANAKGGKGCLFC